MKGADDLFSEDERRALAPFFTRLDGDVFGLRLPQEVAGALFSRYSRSTKSLRRIFLDEFLGHSDWYTGEDLLRLDQLPGGQALAQDPCHAVAPALRAEQSAAVKKAREF